MRAVIFDLYETLITEWDSEKYTTRRCAADLGVDPAVYRRVWEENHSAMNMGELCCEDVWRMICREAAVSPDEGKIAAALARRIESKAQCFSPIRPEILNMLTDIRGAGFRLALCSNASHDETTALRTSALTDFFDELIISCEVHLEKPSEEIYALCAARLGLVPQECIFIGDGASRELYGAAQAGMTPLRAGWFLHGEAVPQPYRLLCAPHEAAECCRSLIRKG